MTHHLIVQFAAFQSLGSLPRGGFRDYCILGDDIVIFHSKVAKAYHNTIISLGVECNLSKSILSPKGLSLEFAKKTFYLGDNVSPSPLKEFYAALESLVTFSSYVKKHKLTVLQAAKVAGFG